MTAIVIVLGDRPDGERPSPEMVSRVRHGFGLALKVGGVILYSGGRTSGRYSEALLMQRVAEDEFPEVQLPSMLESQSLDTIGNAYYSARMLKWFEHESITVVTSPYHVERSGYIFRQVMGKGVTMGTFGHVPDQLAESERQPFELARLLLDDMKPWDIEGLWEKMRKMHPFYSDETLMK